MGHQDTVDKLDSLTPAECRVLYWVCHGLPRKEIAEKLFVAERTVLYHIGHIYEKLDLVHLGRTERQHALALQFCPLVLQRVKDPEKDCARSREDEQEPEPEPSALALALADTDEDAEAGYLPKKGGARGLTPPMSPTVYIEPPLPGTRPWWVSWLAPVLLVGVFLLGMVVVLLAMNLFWRPGPVTVVATATPAPQDEAPVVAAIAQAPLPTYTLLPTLTPQPTYTPYPTPAPVILPTYTLLPTYTPYPTMVSPSPTIVVVTPTAMPTPTAPEVTPADAVLEIGEWWKQDGVWLRLESARLYSSGEITIMLELWNRTGNQLLFTWSEPSNFALIDNNGHRYLAHFNYTRAQNESFNVDQRRRFNKIPYAYTMVYQDTTFFGASVTDLWLVITDMSRISHAKWHIPVPK